MGYLLFDGEILALALALRLFHLSGYIQQQNGDGVIWKLSGPYSPYHLALSATGN